MKSLYLVYLPSSSYCIGEWVNLAQISEAYCSSKPNQVLKIKIRFVDNHVREFTGNRAEIIIRELEKIQINNGFGLRENEEQLQEKTTSN